MTADRWTVEVPQVDRDHQADTDYWDRAERAIEACRRWERERDEARAERDAAQAALARVTDDSMIGRFADEWLSRDRSGVSSTMFEIALDVVRSVAREGQEAGD